MTYNGRTFAEFIPERTSVYVEQEDKHMPELSVRETFNFAALCHGTGGRRGGLVASSHPDLECCAIFWAVTNQSFCKHAGKQSAGTDVLGFYPPQWKSVGAFAGRS